MALREQLVPIRSRAENAGGLLTEEATKNALVMPMLRALGYDVFDPSIVIPEFTADFGVKKGEKVDYAIMVDGEVAILIECKPILSDLATVHASQLYRYFSVTKARFGVLTNGREWRFFTDLDAPNKMDDKPFFIFSVLEYADADLAELEKFSASKFSVNGIISAASDLKLKSLISDALRKEFAQPTEEFVRMIGRRVHEGNLTAEVRQRYGAMILSCIADILRDQANQRLKDAIDRPAASTTALGASTPPPVADAKPAEETAGAIKTTEEELEAFRTIRAILRKNVDVRRVMIRDAASYCAVLLDDNNRRPIARLYLEGRKKRVGIFVNKVETRHEIGSLEDIYSLGDELQKAVAGYLSPDTN
ncbi:type I restriction endonuclease [Falsiroseomonas sp.]|uniref:type I restriction endonuclease n=1 Tax=Falsiroseomonas sp. TaxID=2870721 RepID=UPI003F6EA832